MPHAPHPTTIFPASTSSTRVPSSISSQQSSLLASRIAAKKSELDYLKQLRDLSGTMAGQMSVLEEKLATLRDGTEAVACVLANWDNVLRAIMSVPRSATVDGEGEQQQQQRRRREEGQGNTEGPQLPVTLVRIPAKSQDPRERHVETDAATS